MIPRQIRRILSGRTVDAELATAFAARNHRVQKETRCSKCGVLLSDGANGVRPCPMCEEKR